MQHSQLSEDQLVYCLEHWWHKPSMTNLRLSKTGWQFITAVLKLTNYTFAVPTFSSKMLLLLDKRMDSPYYIHVKHAMPCSVTLFSEADAMMMTLIDNDLARFLSNMKD